MAWFKFQTFEFGLDHPCPQRIFAHIEDLSLDTPQVGQQAEVHAPKNTNHSWDFHGRAVATVAASEFMGETTATLAVAVATKRECRKTLRTASTQLVTGTSWHRPGS